MTPNQLNTLRLFLEGLATGTIDPADIPLLAQFALEGVKVAIDMASEDERVVLAPLRMIRPE